MRRIFFILTIMFLMAAQAGFAQDFNLIGSGARARGMGGAFIGVADDATAVSWNPAGLGRLELPEASIVGLFEAYSEDTDYPDYDTDAYQSSHFSLNFVSAAFPLAVGNRNLVAALAYRQVIDFYYKYEDDFGTEERTGGVYAITPAVGLQLTPTLLIGTSVNIFTGTATYTEEDDFDDYETEYSFSGTNFNIGAMLDVESFRFGIVYKTPFDLNQEVSEFEEETNFGMPKMIGLGVSYYATENLLLAMDYEMRSYSESEVEYVDEDRSVDANWEDINQFRVGLEYLQVSGTSILPLRLGFATTPSLYTDSNDDQIVGANITGGIGLIMGNINLDLGLEYNFYKYEFMRGGETYDFTENFLRFIVSGVFHFGN